MRDVPCHVVDGRVLGKVKVPLGNAEVGVVELDWRGGAYSSQHARLWRRTPQGGTQRQDRPL